jgi:hypothetical protein
VAPSSSSERAPGVVDLDELAQRVRRRVEERRAAGDYPPGLEERLDAHFRRIVALRVVPDEAPLRDLMARLAAMPPFSPERIPTSSRLPGGSVLHATIARLVVRQTTGVLEQVQAFANDVRDLLGLLVERVGSGDTHVHADLLGLLDAVLERVSSYERAPAEADGPLRDLHRRLEAVERSLARLEDLVGRLAGATGPGDASPGADASPGVGGAGGRSARPRGGAGRGRRAGRDQASPPR